VDPGTCTECGTELWDNDSPSLWRDHEWRAEMRVAMSGWAIHCLDTMCRDCFMALDAEVIEVLLEDDPDDLEN
jgi:hypothetical protein